MVKNGTAKLNERSRRVLEWMEENPFTENLLALSCSYTVAVHNGVNVQNFDLMGGALVGILLIVEHRLVGDLVD